jgi:CRP-like cAMP-binding protein
MGVQEFAAMVRNEPSTLLQLLALSKQRLLQLSNNIACSRHHSAEQRVARFILELADITDSSEIHLTHQELADSVGVRRESVSLILKELERKFVLLLERGSVNILDRHAMRNYSCECYEESEIFTV